VLICHAESRLNREALPRWLASFSDLAGIVLIEETSAPMRARVQREIARVGLWRFLDVLAFRVYYGIRFARRDARWLVSQIEQLTRHYSEPPPFETLLTPNPNSVDVEEFLKRLSPDVVIARCKWILQERIFTIPTAGTYVLHPGVCPEYRNAHGAFWALAGRDLNKVGLTLLRTNKGVDTGPVYGYFTYAFDEVRESHIVIMSRLVLENLDAIRNTLLDVLAGRVHAIDTRARPSAAWGQPWLTSYLKWKWRARRDQSARSHDARPIARVP
jgi:hypothetical protein